MVEFDHVRPPESFQTAEEAEAYYSAVQAEAEARKAAARERDQELNEEIVAAAQPLLDDLLDGAGAVVDDHDLEGQL
jgi:hypothetical protein